LRGVIPMVDIPPRGSINTETTRQSDKTDMIRRGGRWKLARHANNLSLNQSFTQENAVDTFPIASLATGKEQSRQHQKKLRSIELEMLPIAQKFGPKWLWR
jgi:hypothetical protein